MDNKMYINGIKVNDLYHLKDFTIEIKENHPHLIITGRNGTGKTTIINSMVEFFNAMFNASSNPLAYRDNLQTAKLLFNNVKDAKQKSSLQKDILFWQKNVENLFSKIEIESNEWEDIIEKHKSGEFIVAFYPASRHTQMIEPKSPAKPEIKKTKSIANSSSSEFLKFLIDLKIQGALARNEKQDKDADDIDKWFNNFQNLLRQLFNDDTIQISFNFRNYQFKILQKDKVPFTFNVLSDGFSAILEIVTDLILKMQEGESISSVYKKAGIVLIDEVDLHLHLQLQGTIMKFLTELFPNIQFIVATHSPFVLNSINDATVYDLEHRESVVDLADYSYSAIAEGYFGVKLSSSYLAGQLQLLKEILSKDNIFPNDKNNFQILYNNIDAVPEASAPYISGEFEQLKIKYSKKIKQLLSNDKSS